MKASVSRALKEAAQRAADNYSKPRDLNVTNETFYVRRVKPLTETTAAVLYRKVPRDEKLKHRRKYALAFFYYVPYKGGTWFHMFISYNHLNSLERLRDMLDWVESQNHEQNDIRK